MGELYKGITPTFTLILADETLDLADATNVYVTFADREGKTILTKETADLIIEDNTVQVYLNQQETLAFPQKVAIQVNWTYNEGGSVKRDCSDIAITYFRNNLINEVIV